MLSEEEFKRYSCNGEEFVRLKAYTSYRKAHVPLRMRSLYSKTVTMHPDLHILNGDTAKDPFEINSGQINILRRV